VRELPGPCGSMGGMDAERRTEKISVSLAPSVLVRLDAYAAEHYWSRSTAIAVLVERGLEGQDD
jgi:metal-responsive CopG/Arc/MetJ family transcriptional regulator